MNEPAQPQLEMKTLTCTQEVWRNCNTCTNTLNCMR